MRRERSEKARRLFGPAASGRRDPAQGTYSGKEPIMSKKQDNAFNFEESLGDLEHLVKSMEEGELSLEESLKAFEQGIRLTRECQTALEHAEQKVQILIDSNAEPQDAGLDTEDE